MNKTIKKRWIEALRSGEYKKGINALKVDDKYCCLGVLTDLYLKEKGLTWDDTAYFSGEPNSRYKDLGSLNNAVIDWAGLKDSTSTENSIISQQLPSNPQLNASIGNQYCSVLNDCCKLPFNEIADLIENSTNL